MLTEIPRSKKVPSKNENRSTSIPEDHLAKLQTIERLIESYKPKVIPIQRKKKKVERPEANPVPIKFKGVIETLKRRIGNSSLDNDPQYPATYRLSIDPPTSESLGPGSYTISEGIVYQNIIQKPYPCILKETAKRNSLQRPNFLGFKKNALSNIAAHNQLVETIREKKRNTIILRNERLKSDFLAKYEMKKWPNMKEKVLIVKKSWSFLVVLFGYVKAVRVQVQNRFALKARVEKIELCFCAYVKAVGKFAHILKIVRQKIKLKHVLPIRNAFVVYAVAHSTKDRQIVYKVISETIYFKMFFVLIKKWKDSILKIQTEYRYYLMRKRKKKSLLRKTHIRFVPFGKFRAVSNEHNHV